ncbi:stage V sporulation protein AA [Gorillibacterium massiliense]|uniref:stage V sporulation protein AA n=1 Tax=Gorillibacterium massiliense TaxID=1280390 RepID=UPI0004B350E8|nr:stage V sporulation protein AA [Gorillibacterium massiliense]
MSAVMDNRLYIRFRKHIALEKGTDITLGRIAQMLAPTELEESLRRLVIVKPEQQDGNMVLVDILQVIDRISHLYPDLQIEHYGEPHILVEIITTRRTPRWLLVAIVWLLLFIGSGLAIMNFHADVSMLAVHRRIYELVTGQTGKRMYMLQIPYSFGIGIGMVLFFNHILKKKFNEEPSPLEVEMYLYQENMHRYVVTEEYGKKNKATEKGVKAPDERYSR